ncbi:MAG TPA: hypothetical protein VJW55_08200, partial [Candidatus Angelobacter sp.]|nr:hypothetical protein [Candidatus Angelobacter sp.]
MGQFFKLTHYQKFFWTILSIPASPFVVIVKAGQLAQLHPSPPAHPFRKERRNGWARKNGAVRGSRLKTFLGEDNMPQYLVSGYLPDNFDPSTQDPAVMEEIH